MEIVIIFSTITAFFSHYLITRVIIANAVSAILAMLATWMLVWVYQDVMEVALLQDLSISALLAILVSVVVGMVFNAHRKCSK